MIAGVIWVIMILSTILGLWSGFNYLNSPFAFSALHFYAGKRYWAVAFICLIVLFLKGKA